jgi:hypothetical protein
MCLIESCRKKQERQAFFGALAKWFQGRHIRAPASLCSFGKTAAVSLRHNLSEADVTFFLLGRCKGYMQFFFNPLKGGNTMKSSKMIIATLVLSLIFLGGTGIVAQAAGTGGQQKKQVRQENTMQNRYMKKSSTPTATRSQIQDRKRLQTKIHQSAD